MNYRIATILPAKSLSGAGTETVDIKLKDVISQLVVKFTATSLGTKLTDHITGMIDKVELVDGSDVLFSLTGEEMEALAYYSALKSPVSQINTKTNYWFELVLPYLFGRYLYDTELAFDPTKFTNPQLKITYDSDGCQASVASGYLEVYAHCFDEKVAAPRGFLMSKQLYTYTPAAASGHEYIDLPTDYPIRKLLIKAHNSAQFFYTTLAHIKLSEDNDKKIPIDLDSQDLVNLMVSLYPKFEERIVNNTTDTELSIPCAPDELIEVAISSEDISSVDNTGIPQGGIIHLVGMTASKSHVLGIKGYMPFGILSLPFGDQQDAGDWYDVTRLGSLRADLTAGTFITSMEAIRLFLQQLRSY